MAPESNDSSEELEVELEGQAQEKSKSEEKDPRAVATVRMSKDAVQEMIKKAQTPKGESDTDQPETTETQEPQPLETEESAARTLTGVSTKQIYAMADDRIKEKQRREEEENNSEE